MLNNAQRAVIKKDVREATSNTMVKVSLIIVPLFMVMVLPVMLTCIAVFAPDEMGEMAPFLSMMPIKFSIGEMVAAGYYYFMNYLMPAFFLLIPVMTASVAAGSSFVGEKERRTLETLMFSPLTIRQLFVSKVVGAMLVALTVTGISFICFLAVAIAGSVLLNTGFVLNIGIWLAILLLLVPSISLLSVTAIVLASAKAKTFQEAQQYAAILIVPVMFIFMLPQVTGIFLLNALQLLLVGIGTLAIAMITLRDRKSVV